jgi:hypothetical protein
MSQHELQSLIVALILSPVAISAAEQASPVDLVNLLIGTGGEGQTFPGVGCGGRSVLQPGGDIEGPSFASGLPDA